MAKLFPKTWRVNQAFPWFPVVFFTCFTAEQFHPQKGLVCSPRCRANVGSRTPSSSTLSLSSYSAVTGFFVRVVRAITAPDPPPASGSLEELQPRLPEGRCSCQLFKRSLNTKKTQTTAVSRRNSAGAGACSTRTGSDRSPHRSLSTEAAGVLGRALAVCDTSGSMTLGEDGDR